MAKWVQGTNRSFINLDNFVSIRALPDPESEEWVAEGFSLIDLDEKAAPWVLGQFSLENAARAYIEDLLNWACNKDKE